MRRFPFLHTLMHALDRLSPSERATAEQLDAWLDQRVTSATAPGEAASAADSALLKAAQQLHELSVHTDAHETGLDETRQRIWEEIMAQRPKIIRSGVGAPLTGATPARPILLHLHRLSQAATRWSPAFNTAMVLVLLVALVAGVAGYFNHRSGSGEPTQPARLAAISSPTSATGTPTKLTTPAAVETPVATTIGAPAPEETFGGALPTPKECTVKPLTIDEVMARLGYKPLTPAEQEATRNAAATRIANHDPDAALPGPGTPLAEPTRRIGEPGRQPTEAEIKGVVAAHRQLIACIMKRSPLQIWAMIDPGNRYWRDLAAFAIPPFTDPAIVRMKLEGFISGKNWLFPDPTQMLPPLGMETPMVNPDPATARAYQSPDHLDNSLTVSVSMLYYSPRNPANSPYTTSTVTSPSYGRDQGDGWSYRYNPTLKQWLLVYHSGNFSQQG